MEPLYLECWEGRYPLVDREESVQSSHEESSASTEPVEPNSDRTADDARG
jgi:hypothetical protein